MSNSTGVMYEMDGEDVAKVFFRILIYVIGVIGNLLVIFVILFLKEYKKITHWYVLQMALADIIFLQNLPVKVTEDINGRWVNAEWLCSAQQTVLFFTYYASILFLTIMAIDRYLAVCHPMSETVRRARTVRHAYIVSIVTWIISLGLSVPAMLYGTTSGTSPFCTCNLVFPLDARDWCLDKGFTEESGFLSLDFCLETVFPDVDQDTCIADDSDIDFGDVGLPPLSTGVGAGDAGNSGDSLPVLGGSDLPDFSDPFAGTEDGNLFPPSTDDSAGLDITSLFNEIDENDLKQPSAASSTSGTGSQLFGSCYYDPQRPGFIAYIIFNFVAMFLIPFLVLVVCYSLIVRRLVGSNLSGNSSNGSSKKAIFKSKTPSTASATTGRSDREKTKVTILCFLLAALFTICWLPFHSVHLAKVVGIRTDDEGFCGRLATGTSLLAYFGSAINPYLYNFLGSFKKRIKQIKSSTAFQSASATTGATAAPRTSIPRSSIVPSTDGSRGANSVAPPEEIPLNDVETRL